MAQETISILFDNSNGKMAVGGISLNTQEEKDHAIQLFLSAINLVVVYRPSVIQPANSIPHIPPTNGKGPVRLAN